MIMREEWKKKDLYRFGMIGQAAELRIKLSATRVADGGANDTV